MPLAKLLMVCGGVYAAQGIIGGLTYQGLPAVLRANQVSLDQIGLVFLAMIPWALKFLWAPALERLRIGHDNQRRSRPIILTGQLICVALLVVIAFIGFQSFHILLIVALLLAAVAATVDIACDGFIIEQLTSRTRGWGNTAQMGGGYVGFLIGGGLFLWVNGHYGWQAGALTMALFLVMLMLPFLFVAEPQQPKRVLDHRPSLRFALSRREVLIGIAIMLLYDLGIRIASGLAGPFMVDQGISLATIGLLSGVGGIIAGLCGTLLGGAAVRYSGAKRAVVIAILLQALILGVFYFVSSLDTPPTEYVMAVVLVKSLVMGFGFVSIYSLLMGLSSLRQAGVDFTIFQCADAAIAALGGFGAGVLAENFGYASVFALAACLSVIAFVVVTGFLLRQLQTHHLGDQGELK